MDLIDASNVPAPVTVDPVTGNTVPANGNNSMTEDNQLADAEGYDDEADDEGNYITDNTPTSHDFSALPSETKAKIVRLLKSISPFWGDLSPATPFPIQYLPDPDVHNWGLPLITALHRLADLTRSAHKRDAIYWTIRHMKERNEIDGNIADEDISVSMMMAGDFVIRLEDIEDSIRKMRSRVNTYRPDYQGRDRGRGRGNYRGRRGDRGGRGGGAHGFGGHSISSGHNPLA